MGIPDDLEKLAAAIKAAGRTDLLPLLGGLEYVQGQLKEHMGSMSVMVEDLEDLTKKAKRKGLESWDIDRLDRLQSQLASLYGDIDGQVDSLGDSIEELRDSTRRD